MKSLVDLSSMSVRPVLSPRNPDASGLKGAPSKTVNADPMLHPRQIHSTKTGRASEAPRRKSLIVNDRISHLPPKSSGNVRFCTSTAPTCPGPIRGNPKLRAERLPEASHNLKSPTPALARCNTSADTSQSLHRVAACCSVLHRVSPEMFFTPQMQHLPIRLWCRPRALTRRCLAAHDGQRFCLCAEVRSV